MWDDYEDFDALGFRSFDALGFRNAGGLVALTPKLDVDGLHRVAVRPGSFTVATSGNTPVAIATTPPVYQSYRSIPETIQGNTGTEGGFQMNKLIVPGLLIAGAIAAYIFLRR